MGIFDWLFGKKETKKNCCSKKEDDKTKGRSEVKGRLRFSLDENSKSKLRVNVKDLEYINDLNHYKEVLFTGVYYQNYPNGNLLYETEQLNGKDHGTSKRYKGDGTIHSVVNFSDGKLHDEDKEKEDEFMKYMRSEVTSQIENE